MQMNFFGSNFKRSDLISTSDVLKKLFLDYQILCDIQQKYYPLLHYGQWISINSTDRADEFERVKKKYLDNFKNIQYHKFENNMSVDNVMSMSEDDLKKYIDDYLGYIKKCFQDFENENAKVLYYLIMGNAITKYQSSAFDEFDIDISKAKYANWINTNQYYDFLFELIKTDNDSTAIEATFKKYIDDEKVAKEFITAYSKLYEKWQMQKRNSKDISAITVSKFYEANGAEMSVEFKNLLDDILLNNDKEYQKMVNAYGNYKEFIKL